MERLQRECQLGLWRLETRQGVHWCDLGLWGWSAGGGSQGGSIDIKSLLWKSPEAQQAQSSPDLHERNQVFGLVCTNRLPVPWGDLGPRENLEAFLSITDELKVAGLSGDEGAGVGLNSDESIVRISDVERSEEAGQNLQSEKTASPWTLDEVNVVAKGSDYLFMNNVSGAQRRLPNLKQMSNAAR